MLQFSEQRQDLRLHRDIKGAGRLVADDESGFDCPRPRDADALALAAREFVRVVMGMPIRFGDANGALSDIGALAADNRRTR